MHLDGPFRDGSLFLFPALRAVYCFAPFSGLSLRLRQVEISDLLTRASRGVLPFSFFLAHVGLLLGLFHFEFLANAGTVVLFY